MANELITREYDAKILAATALSESLSFCLERKYLQRITDSDSCESLFEVEAISVTDATSVSWIQITQIGRPLEKSAEGCFTAIQKILYSCFIPKELQLLFLIIGDGTENHLYLGLRSPNKAVAPKSIVRNLNEFIKGVWPGLQTKIIKDENEDLCRFKECISSETYDNIYTLTGIPSMESQYKTLYPATIDKLIAGMSKSKNYSYMVVADPIENSSTEYMLYQCREMNGQAESLKSMNVTEGFSQGRSITHSSSHTEGVSKSVSESITKKDFSRLGKLAIGATGLGVAASFFPAAAEVLDGVADISGELVSAAAGCFGGSIASGIIGSLTPTISTSTTNSENSSDTESYSQGTNENKSQSLSRNIVNKHIEAVSEHLFYHSKRIETGKAIGLWKVGVYLMAERKSDINSAALQLRSILSGQESIFEPIRIHDITDVINEKYREQTIGNFTSPKLRINNRYGNPFNHPLDTADSDHYKELKTVLTTKELSYLINFPLRSVPGISVVDSSPEFSLNQSDVLAEADSVDFGRLLYGGTETEMSYRLPIDLLAKHTLLSGINGTGKTNTVQSILNSLQGKIPFLIIEPAKSEYVDWAVEYNKLHPETPIDIYIPGCKSYKDKQTRKPIVNQKILKINPFEVVWLNKEQEPNVLTHIDRLKSTFAAAFPMYDILPILMEDLIYTIYQNKTTDWLTQEPEYGKTLPPTLNSMSIGVDKVISNRGYEERIERNMKACLNTRIDSLKRGWKGEMLNTVHSTPWKELFEKPCVINLSYVGDDVDKAFFMAIILQFLYEYRTACAEIGEVDFNDNSCKHLTVIEEAHRVMMKCEKADDPQYKSAMMFSNMLSEIRAYGEGMMLVDQVPTRLIPDAIKNTNTKITHRLVAEDDCTAVAESMGISKEQKMIIPKLLVGQCLVSTSLTTDKHWVKVNKVK